jgi:hypothetical protein
VVQNIELEEWKKQHLAQVTNHNSIQTSMGRIPGHIIDRTAFQRSQECRSDRLVIDMTLQLEETYLRTGLGVYRCPPQLVKTSHDLIARSNTARPKEPWLRAFNCPPVPYSLGFHPRMGFCGFAPCHTHPETRLTDDDGVVQWQRLPVCMFGYDRKHPWDSEGGVMRPGLSSFVGRYAPNEDDTTTTPWSILGCIVQWTRKYLGPDSDATVNIITLVAASVDWMFYMRTLDEIQNPDTNPDPTRRQFFETVQKLQF